MNFILLQSDGPTSTSVLDMVTSIGIIGIVVIGIIFLLSIVAVYIFFERYGKIKKAQQVDPHFMNNIKDFVSNGNITGARDMCLRNDSPVARMIEKGISRIGRPLKDISASVENTGNLEVFKLEKNLSTLATIAGAAPMLGFLGTVTGMIQAFYKLSQAGNNIDPGMLAGGIYEAMLTTAAGLAVGIIAFISYNVLVSMVQGVIFKMEANSVEFLDLLQEPSK